ncbi:MAG: nucleotidyl transferase AbiEii/AbiGii toxin family protein [Betaproteobacteria bacterium]|nr:nucleotidyl transferase AbiEii/AbiGii toxin family protein [Betaproteobacteria bacterium]
MFAADNPYLPQARLAVRLLRFVAEESAFALKGGTAINLFYRDSPRLSVDLDLTYVPLFDRQKSLAQIAAALRRIAGRARHALPGVRIDETGVNTGKLVAKHHAVHVKVEVNTVLRGSVLPPLRRTGLQTATGLFGDIEAQTLSFEDVYAGKLVAALDRQHARDLFDVRLLLEGEGITEALLDAFVVYLASHDRPIAEILDPKEKDIRDTYERSFADMAAVPVEIETLIETRRAMIDALHLGLNDRQRAFLLSVKRCEPDWSRLSFSHVANLPGLRWKLHNLERLRSEQPARHAEALANLQRVLEKIAR